MVVGFLSVLKEIGAGIEDGDLHGFPDCRQFRFGIFVRRSCIGVDYIPLIIRKSCNINT